MAWLLRQGEVLASLELAKASPARLGPAAGGDPGCGALLLRWAVIVHSMGAPAPMDVAFLDAGLVVVSTTSLAPYRICVSRRGARQVLKAPAGAFERWNLHHGDQLEVKE